MTAPKPAVSDEGVLVLAPPRGANAIDRAVREANLKPELCNSLDHFCEKFTTGAVAALLSTRHLSHDAIPRLRETLSQAEPWSDVPLILLCPAKPRAAGQRHLVDALSESGTVFRLEEPIHAPSLITLLRFALRGRQRQYALRDLLRQQRSAAEQIELLSQQMEAFIYSVSHDLRAPLRAIRGFAQALSEDYGPSLDATGQEYLHRMEQGGERLDQLIQDLLRFSRLGRAPLNLSPIRLQTSLERVIEQLHAEIRGSSASVEISKPLPTVMADGSVLQQVLQALLSNAVKFIAPGVQPHVRIWGTSNGASARLWIADNGIGIAPAHHQRIFGVFERLHSGESYPGTGMGLAIVSRGMDRLGGSVGLESTLGEGSRFWIELPHPS